MVSFVGQEYATTVLYPDTQDIELIEDFYNVTVHVYKESTITLDGYENTKCVEAPVDGVGSLFGLTEEKCFDLNVPSLEVESALIGGGRTQEFITEDILQRSQELNINVPMFFEPTKVEDLQANFILADDSPVYINFA